LPFVAKNIVLIAHSILKGVSMGALPKNKITRAERGKRRRGNTPTITQDTKVKTVRSHKAGFMAELMKFVGLNPTGAQTGKTTQPTEASKTDKKSVKATADNPMAQRTVPSRRSIAPAGKGKRQTQHKG
jgi:hypothetical protein